VIAALATWLAGCAGDGARRAPERKPESIQPETQSLIPPSVSRRAVLAVDLHLVFTGLKLDPSPANRCAVLTIPEHESNSSANTAMPNLPKIAHAEVLGRAGRRGVQALVANQALQWRSPGGRSI
jgi:hypothetical protein